MLVWQYMTEERESSAIVIMSLGADSTPQKDLKETRYSHLRHYGLNVSAPSPNFYVESLIPKVIAIGCGALGEG